MNLLLLEVIIKIIGKVNYREFKRHCLLLCSLSNYVYACTWAFIANDL
jgi:hypothetical protein